MLLGALLLPTKSLAAPVYDALGGPVLLLLAGGGLSLIIVGMAAERLPGLAVRLGASAATGSLLLAAFFAIFPGSLASPYAAVDPLVAMLWLDRVSETMSLRTMLILEPERVLGNYVFPLLTLILAAVVTKRVTPDLRFRWILASVMLAAAFAVSLWQVR